MTPKQPSRFRRAIRAFRGQREPKISAQQRALARAEKKMAALGGEQNGVNIQTLDPFVLGAQKAMPYNQYVQDFISGGGAGGSNYYDRSILEGAYRTSVYLFSALRKVAYLMSSLPVIIEHNQRGTWTEVNNPEFIPEFFWDNFRTALKEAYLNYAIYGSSLLYKEKTEKGVQAWRGGELRSVDLKKGHIARLRPIPGSKYTIDADWSTGSIRGFNLGQTEEGVGTARYLKHGECVYWHDYDPVDDFEGTPIVATAIHSAMSDSAIRRWTAQYFSSGAMPMILVAYDTDPALTSETDLVQQKQFFEKQWRGTDGSLRSVFVDRKVDVQQVGIDADKVAAPELSRSALEGISGAIGIAPDLIVPPEGGTQERHRQLIKAAWQDVVIPTAEGLLDAINAQIGLPEGYRFAIAINQIEALNADRDFISGIETSIYGAGLQSVNEARGQLGLPRIKELNRFLNVGGTPASVQHILRRDRVDTDMLNALLPAWNDSLLTRGQVLQLMGFDFPTEKDGYKFEIVVEGSGGAALGTDIVEANNSVPQTPKPGELTQGEDGKLAYHPNSGKPEDDGPEPPESPKGGGSAKPKEPKGPATPGAAQPPGSSAAEASSEAPVIAVPDGNSTLKVEEVDSPTTLVLSKQSEQDDYLDTIIPLRNRERPGRPAAKDDLTLLNEGMVTLPLARKAGDEVGVDWQQITPIMYRRALQSAVVEEAIDNWERLIERARAVYDTLDLNIVAEERQEFYASVAVPGVQGLKQLQEWAKERWNGEWVSSDDWHITLFHSDAPTPASALRTLKNNCSPQADGFMARPTEMRTWETNDGPCLVVLLEKTPDLMALYREIYDAATGEGCQPSQLIKPEQWQPHIAMAYQAIRKPDAVNINQLPAINIPVVLVRLFIDFELVKEIRLTRPTQPVKASQNTAMEELAAWEKVARKNLKRAANRFEVNQLPDDVAGPLRASLKTAKRGDLNDLFDTARAKVFDYTNNGVDIVAMGQWLTGLYQPFDSHFTSPRILTYNVYKAVRQVYIKNINSLLMNYRANLYTLFEKVFDIDRDTGKPAMAKTPFLLQGKRLIGIYLQAAFEAGLGEVGTDESRLGEERKRIADEIKQEQKYFADLRNEIYEAVPLYLEALALQDDMNAEKDPAARNQLQQELLSKLRDFEKAREKFTKKVNVWVNKGAARLYEMGKVLGGKALQRYRWEFDPTKEHCLTCVALNGQVHTMRGYTQQGLLPKHSTLLCHGDHCGCKLVPTDEPARGRLSRVPRAESAKEGAAALVNEHDLGAVTKWASALWNDDPEMKSYWDRWIQEYNNEQQND